MASRRKPDTPMSAELRDRLERLVADHRAARVKEDQLVRRREGHIAPLRIAMGELIDKYNERANRVLERRRRTDEEFLALWAEHFPGHRTIVLPSATVSKRRGLKITVRDKREVIDALDRLDRLDLVSEEVDEKGLRALVRKGKLDGLPEGAIEVEESVTILPFVRKD